MGKNKSTATKMKVNHWQIQLPWQCGGTTRGASPDREVQGFTGIHWMPPSGECLRCVVPAAVMVNEFVETTQNTNKNKTQLLASNYGTFRALVVCENFIPQHRPSTQLIDATNFVKWNVKCNDWSWRARNHFWLSNIISGQKVKKLSSDHKAR